MKRGLHSEKVMGAYREPSLSHFEPFDSQLVFNFNPVVQQGVEVIMDFFVALVHISELRIWDVLCKWSFVSGEPVVLHVMEVLVSKSMRG